MQRTRGARGSVLTDAPLAPWSALSMRARGIAACLHLPTHASQAHCGVSTPARAMLREHLAMGETKPQHWQQQRRRCERLGPRRAGRGVKALLAKGRIHCGLAAATCCGCLLGDAAADAVPLLQLPAALVRLPTLSSHGKGPGAAQDFMRHDTPSLAQVSRTCTLPRTRSRRRRPQPRPNADLMLAPFPSGPRRMCMAAARTARRDGLMLPCFAVGASSSLLPRLSHTRARAVRAPAPPFCAAQGDQFFARRTAKRVRPECLPLRHTALSDGGPPGARGTVRMRGAERGRGPGDHQPLQGSARCRSWQVGPRGRARATLGSACCWPAASAAGRRQHGRAHVRGACDRALAPGAACGQSPGTTHEDLLLLSHSATPSAPISRQAASLLLPSSGAR